MRIHFIAIGGSAMHNLALAMHHKGYKVSGSDDEIFEPSKTRLKKYDLLPAQFGWFPEKLDKNIDAVILGMHAKEDNPELKKARDLCLAIYSYPEYLYEQSRFKTRIVIGGSHGKTTITSMILHVMHYHGRDVDYMVGAQLEGFDTMVRLTEENDFIVLEGDEYLSSALDRRPKFHLYKPNIALLSGIAWDHINVFPTAKEYIKQFEIFISQIVDGGILVYNDEDPVLTGLVEKAENPIRKQAYSTPPYVVKEGIVYLETDEGLLPMMIFGDHNMNNLAGAKWICQHMGIDEIDFYEAIATFSGASMRLEKLAGNSRHLAYKDFAHSPSKVVATTQAAKSLYPNRKLIACLELHTYSSLHAGFLTQYKGSLDEAEVAVVFYSPHALEIKGLEKISQQQICEAFGHKDLKVFTSPLKFK